MTEFDKTTLKYFLEQQSQLFPGPKLVAETIREARDFLEESMAVVVSTKEEVKAYFEENDMDVSGMSDDEILNQSEVFHIPDGRYLIIEG